VRFLFTRLLFVCAAVVAVSPCAAAAEENPLPLVNIKGVAPGIVVDLRYAGSNNIAGRPLYRPGTKALVRPEVAQRLALAHRFLRRYSFQLKIWDAYRPRSVQIELWQASRNNDFVQNPDAGAGSLHSWGLAVDATLTDFSNQVVSMPTDFDDFTPAAMWKYTGSDPSIATHLRLLQIAMRDAGFYGLRSEWWHFTVANWQKFLPPEEAKRAEEEFARATSDRTQ
jgi:D-alanyl-D-alanine dipeptidase